MFKYLESLKMIASVSGACDLCNLVGADQASISSILAWGSLQYVCTSPAAGVTPCQPSVTAVAGAHLIYGLFCFYCGAVGVVLDGVLHHGTPRVWRPAIG